jgi:hypothetical protein
MNVGDNPLFTLQGAPPDGGYTYVYKWWDQTVDVSRLPSIYKLINQGGSLQFSVTQCDGYGQSNVYSGSIVVNFPPALTSSPTISSNDQSFPFSTVLGATAYDPEHPGGTELTFGWYDGPALISSGTTAIVSTGTYRNDLFILVGSDQTLTQRIIDFQNGVTQINYFIRGFSPTGLQGSTSSISNSIVSSANNLSEVIIGPGQQATFTAYAQDTSPGQLQFLWTAGTLNGWTAPFQTTDTPSVLANGLYRSQIVLGVSIETPGLKTVQCEVTNLQTLQSIDFDATISLLAAQAPTITSISTDAPVINGGYAVSQAGFVHFSAAASDPNNALLSYQWNFSQPSLVLFGRTVMLRPQDYPIFDEVVLTGSGTTPGTGPLPIIGQVTVTDRFGQSSTVNLNQFITTLVWPFTQVAPQTSGTGSTSLQKRYWGVSDQSTISLNDLATLNSDFSSQRNQSVTFNASAQYLYIIYPSVFGAATINVNGTIATDWLLTVLAFNAVTYNIYRSATAVTGAFQVVIS